MMTKLTPYILYIVFIENPDTKMSIRCFFLLRYTVVYLLEHSMGRAVPESAVKFEESTVNRKESTIKS